MKNALQLEITFSQILTLIKQLPKKEKLKLTKELEKDVIDSKLSKLLNAFKTDDINVAEITYEVEAVRKKIYENQKH